VADGPSSDVLTTLDKMTKRTVAMKIPSNQPTANPALVLPARLESNIKIVAMTATGDTATPTANGRSSPTTEPMSKLISDCGKQDRQ